MPPGSPERRDDAYFDYALGGIVDADASGTILRANPAAASITGQDRQALPGRRLQELALAEESASLGEYLSMLPEQGIGHLETRLIHADGTTLVVELSSVQVAENLFVHFFEDVTGQRRLMENLHAAGEAAEAANRAKSAFLANISHEVRTPMNGIIGLSKLALMRNSEPGQRELLENIHRSGTLLLKVINNLLDFSKLEAGKTEFERIPFELDELLDELATVASSAPASPSVELVFHPRPGLPRVLCGDHLRLGQILNNLLANALKFTEEGRVELFISPEGRQQDRLWLRFDVADTGIGISRQAMERLFQPFGQADATTTRRFGGTGLGLVIARELALGMGGTLTVHSEPGIGSTFTLRLPCEVLDHGGACAEAIGGRFALDLARSSTRAAVEGMLVELGLTPADDPDDADLLVIDLQDSRSGDLPRAGARTLLAISGPQKRRSAPATADPEAIIEVTRPLTPGSLRRALRRLDLVSGGERDAVILEAPDDFVGARLLVAEDEPVNQIVIRGLLEMAGIEVTLAADGQRALDILDNGPVPDLVLMDVHMPVMDGLDATRTLRQRGFGLPIVGTSAGASADEQRVCLDAGMNDFLPKPLDADELWGCLTRWLPAGGRRPPRPVEQPGERTSAGEREALARARRVFVASYSHEAARLAEALEAGDRDAAARIAHRLKGAAGAVGAAAIADLAGTVERLLRDPTNGDSEIGELLAQLGLALAAATSGGDR